MTFTLSPDVQPPDMPTGLLSSADMAGGYTGLVSREVVVHKLDPNTPAAHAVCKWVTARQGLDEVPTELTLKNRLASGAPTSRLSKVPMRVTSSHCRFSVGARSSPPR